MKKRKIELALEGSEPWKTFSYFDELLWRGKAANTQWQQDPAAGVAALGRVLGKLFADLTVDFISGMEKECLQSY